MSNNELVLLRRIEELEKLTMRQPEIGGVWQSYTPKWTAATTNPTIGDGTLIGRYTTIGKTCFVDVTLIMGSSTTYGSGEWRITLPFVSGQRISANFSSHGTGWINDTSGGAEAAINIVVRTISYEPYIRRFVTTKNFIITATSPITWESGDWLAYSLAYEIA